MAECSPSINSFQAESSTLDVLDKYKLLMQATLGDNSIYERAKETYLALFEVLQVTEKEKAEIVAQNITTIAKDLSNSAMVQAVQWAKEERDGAYTLAKLKADTEISLANYKKIEAEICVVEQDKELKCAQTESTLATSIRENGKVLSYDSTGCKPESLENSGLKYEQTKQIGASTYQIFADSFRKSGVVKIGIDPEDTKVKGMSGDDAGHTNEQTKFTNRQTKSFEDSKRNHSANSSAQMIGQLLSSEEFSTSNAEDVVRWRTAIDYLNTDTP